MYDRVEENRKTKEISRMKGPIVKFVKWMVILGVIGVIGGAFLPFIGWEFFGGSDYINFFGVMDEVEIYILPVIMGGALLVMLIAGNLIEKSTRISTSIWLVVAAIAGEISLRYYLAVADEEILFFRYGLGKVIMEGAYIVLIVAAFFSLGIDIYTFYIRKGQGSIKLTLGFRCPKCGKTISKESKFCGACGFSLDSLNCPECGTRRETNAQFCKECGKMLPAIKTGENGAGFITQSCEDNTSIPEQRIRDSLIITLTLMTLFAILALIIGIFFPYVKSYNYINDEWETVHRLINAFTYEACEDLKSYLIIMGIGVIVSHVSLVGFGKCNNISASIVMVLAAVGGRYFLGMYKEDVFILLQSDYLKVEEAMGVSVLEIAYVVLIFSALVALAIDIYDIYISKRVKEVG